jgi:hypothetical protein
VSRYGAAEPSALLGEEFTLLTSRLQDHRTPSGTSQQFLYAHLVRGLYAHLVRGLYAHLVRGR